MTPCNFSESIKKIEFEDGLRLKMPHIMVLFEVLLHVALFRKARISQYRTPLLK